MDFKKTINSLTSPAPREVSLEGVTYILNVLPCFKKIVITHNFARAFSSQDIHLTLKELPIELRIGLFSKPIGELCTYRY